MIYANAQLTRQSKTASTTTKTIAEQYVHMLSHVNPVSKAFQESSSLAFILFQPWNIQQCLGDAKLDKGKLPNWSPNYIGFSLLVTKL